MRKVLLFAFLLCAKFNFAQETLLAFDFATSFPNSSSNMPEVQPSTLPTTGLVRSGPVGGIVTYSGWNLEANDYIEFTLTPSTGFTLTVFTISLLNTRRNPTGTTGTRGPESLVIRTSLDNFSSNASNVAAVPNTSGTVSFGIFGVVNISAPVVFRIYAVSSGGGTPNSRQIIIGGPDEEITVDGIAGSILPVHFSNLKAKEKSNGVQVDFTNLTESDIDYYEIERSANGRDFTSVHRLPPSQNNYGAATYNWLDAGAKEGRNIYKIKAVETTGNIVYSEVVAIHIGAKAAGLNINATGSQIAVQVNSLPAGKYQFRILNAAGQLLSAENINHSGGSISQRASLKNARAGVYIFEVRGLVNLQKKFVVQ